MDNLSHPSETKRRAFKRIAARNHRSQQALSNCIKQNAQLLETPADIESCSIYLTMALSVAIATLFSIFTLVVYILIGLSTLFFAGLILTILPLALCVVRLQGYYQDCMTRSPTINTESAPKK